MADRVTWCVVEQFDADGVVVKFHAVEIKDGEIDRGDDGPELVNSECSMQLHRDNVKRDLSWQALLTMSAQGDLAGRGPLCENCIAWADVHHIHRGEAKSDVNYHLVKASFVASGVWLGRCGRPVVHVGPIRLWDGGCGECDAIAGDSMRVQMAQEEAERRRGGWEITPS